MAGEARGENLSGIRNPVSEIRFYDRFRNRVMFPICNDLGEVIAFSGRVLAGDATEAKYVNSPETMLFTKGNVLFGLHKSKRALIDKNSAIVCEGQLDLITAFEAGVQNVIAPQGTAFTEKQARILKRYVEEVVLCFDSDAAGQKAAERSLASLLDANLFVRVAEMPAGHDPDSLIREKGAEAFAERIAGAQDFFDHQIDTQTKSPEFATPRGKMQFAKKMAESASLVTDAVMREAIINKVTARLEISARDFRAMMKAPRGGSPEIKPHSMENSPFQLRGIRMLCALALQDRASFDWLRQQNWHAVLAETPDGEILSLILSSDFRPGDSASVARFLAQLNSDQESLLSSLFARKLPDLLTSAIRGWWDLERRFLENTRETLAARLRLPNLTADEITKVQKEILDLQKRLTDIARPFSSPPQS
jgi:DNA primase